MVWSQENLTWQQPPKILFAMAAIEGSAVVSRFDVIEHQGRHWIVPAWLDQLGKGASKPARIIPLDLLGATATKGNDFQFVLSSPLPKALLDPEVPSELARRYGVVDLPDILVPRVH
jgi:hypothetical protein